MKVSIYRLSPNQDLTPLAYYDKVIHHSNIEELQHELSQVFILYPDYIYSFKLAEYEI